MSDRAAVSGRLGETLALHAWNAFVVLATILLAVWLPLDLVFDFDAWGQDRPLRALAGLVFVTDAIVRLLVARDVSDDASAAGARRRRASRRWILLDILAALPLAWLTGDPALEIVRLAKLARVGNILGDWRLREMRYADELQLASVLGWMILGAHWIACGWAALRGVEPGRTVANAYVDAVYWTVTTLTTVGYGDVVPANSAEKWYAIGTMVLGLAFLGYLIGLLATSWARRDPARMQYRQSLERLATASKFARLPRPLQQRIHDYHYYVWKQRLGYDEATFLNELPPDLRAEVSLHMRRDLLQACSLFRDLDPPFLKEIVEHLRPIVVTPGDVVCRVGEPGEEMYFIARGEVEARTETGSVLRHLGPGDFFGEIALVRHAPRTATVVAQTYCDLYALSRPAFEHAAEHHPDLFRRIDLAARIRESGEGRTPVS